MNSTSTSSRAAASPALNDSVATERELVERLKAGDAEAYQSLIQRFRARLLTVARQMLGCEAESDDAVQDAFVSAFQRLTSFRGESQLATWLHRIVVNACLMRLRAKRRRPTIHLDELLPKLGVTRHHAAATLLWRNSPHELLCNAESRQQVRHCIEELPTGQREILLLRDIEGLDIAETAALLDESVSVVKTRLHRARLALRTLLEPHFVE